MKNLLREAPVLALLAACSHEAPTAPLATVPVTDVPTTTESLNAELRTDTNYALDTYPDLSNPERGVAYWTTNTAPEVHTVEYHFLWLGEVCDTDLDWRGIAHANTSAVLREWANTAVRLRDQGIKVIFRPRYDTPAREGAPNRCGKVEGASYAQMKSHAEVIGKMLADTEVRPSIAFIEMGYLGSWGEWNTGNVPCSIAEVASCRAYAPVLLAATPEEDRIHLVQAVVNAYRDAGVARSVALRRPEYHRDVVENLGVPSTSLGFHNDCFMSSDTDVGTFTRLRWDYADYHELYPKSVFSDEKAAKAYLQSNSGLGSVGGETCGESGPWKSEPLAVPARLEADGFHYLHGTYAKDFRATMIAAGVWDTIKSRLGYRYQVLNVNYPETVPAGASVTVNIDIQNSGFAEIPNERRAYLALHGPTHYVVASTNPQKAIYTQIAPETESNTNLRSWKKGSTTRFSQSFTAPSVSGTYTIQLYAPDPDCVDNASCSDSVRSNFAVRMATTRDGKNIFNGNTGTNDLGVTLTVTAE